MDKYFTIVDVGDPMKRFMIDAYKTQMQNMKLDPTCLQGSWSEASFILKSYFGKLTGIEEGNEGKLLTLYQTALEELRCEA